MLSVPQLPSAGNDIPAARILLYQKSLRGWSNISNDRICPLAVPMSSSDSPQPAQNLKHNIIKEKRP